MATPEFVVVSADVNLGPNRWWQFKDVGTGGKARVECAQPAADRYHLKISIRDRVTEHFLKTQQVDLYGNLYEQYTLIQSKMFDQTFTWGDGLVIPVEWKVGDRVSAVSQENFPWTGNPASLILKLKKSGNFKPPGGTPFPPDTDLLGIEIEYSIRDARLGTTFSTGTAVFITGMGLLAAQLEVFGTGHKLQFEDWSGAHLPKPPG